jgi:single-stranded DNA-binding protein
MAQGFMNGDFKGAITFISEPRKTHTNKTVVNLSLVIERDKYNRETNQYDRATDDEKMYFSATAFGRLADNIILSLKPGDRVVGDGEFQAKPRYTDKNGVEHKNEIQLVLNKLGPDLSMWPVQLIKTPKSGSASTAAAPRAASEPKTEPKVVNSGSEDNDPFSDDSSSDFGDDPFGGDTW